jgi:hypothetical protein
MHSAILAEQSAGNGLITLNQKNVDKRILNFLREVPGLSLPAVGSLLVEFKGKTLKDIIGATPEQLKSALPWYTEQRCRNIAHYFSRTFELDTIS